MRNQTFQKGNEKMSRRNMVFGLGAAALAAGLGLYVAGGPGKTQVEDSKSVPALVSLSELRVGGVKPNRYFESILSDISSYNSLKAAGAVNGILYSPTDQELAEVGRSVMGSRVDKAILEKLVKDNTTACRTQINRCPVTFTPKSFLTNLFATKTGRYLVFNPAALDSKIFVSDRDVTAAAIYRLSELRSAYFGRFGNAQITPEQINSGEYSLPFVADVSQLTAAHETLRSMLCDVLGCKGESASREHMESMAKSYNSAFENLSKAKKTDSESALFDSQTQALRGEFELTKGKDGLNHVEFNLLGKKGNYEF